MRFLSNSKVVIHNAAFDVSFLDSELARLRLPPMGKRDFTVEDSLALARKKYPGKRNSLDALCDRMGVDNTQRNLHGALLDARLLADVYLAMTRGQGSLEIAPPDVKRPTLAIEYVFIESHKETHIFSVDLPDEVQAIHKKITEGIADQSGVSYNW